MRDLTCKARFRGSPLEVVIEFVLVCEQKLHQVRLVSERVIRQESVGDLNLEDTGGVSCRRDRTYVISSSSLRGLKMRRVERW